MSSKISALTAASALAGTEVLPVVQSGATVKATVAQVKTHVVGLGAQQVFAGALVGANFNTTADQAISITLPPGFTKWRLSNVFISSASVSLTTAVGGFYTGASKSGTTLIANTQTYTTLTGAAVNSTGTWMTATNITAVTNTLFNHATIFFALTTPQGVAATADIYIAVIPYP